MSRRRCQSRAWVGSIVSVLLGWSATSAWGADHHWVTPDGKKHSLSRSNSELLIELRDARTMDATVARLDAQGQGKLENLKSDGVSRFKVLSGTDAARAPQIKNDPDIATTHYVYRYDDTGAVAMSSGTIVVKVRAGVNEADRLAMWAQYGLNELRHVHRLDGVYLLTPIDPDADEVLIAEQLSADARLAWANPNFFREHIAMQSTPSDAYFDLQWHLQNTGQSGGTVGADIDALGAWDLGTGEGIIVGMFDDSCDVDHEDLKDRYIGIGQDVTLPFFDADYNNPRPKRNGDAHGTAVMGLAVASANTLGVRGVAYNAKFTASSGLLFATDEQTASAYSFALDQNVDVHINSWGFRVQFPTPAVLEDAIVEAATQGRDPDGNGPLPPRGMVILFSSGNESIEIKSGLGVATIPEVIAVGASTEEDLRAGFSNYGEALSFLAPGSGNVNLGVTTTDAEDGPNKPSGYNVGGVGVDPDTGQQFGPDIDPGGKYTGFFGGTSAACPIAAGVAAVILSINPQLTASDVRLIMQHTSDSVHPEDASYDPVTSHSFKFGYGRINAARAAQAAKQSLTNGNLSWPASPKNPGAQGTTLSWTTSEGTNDFLVLESQDILAFKPVDGQCYGSDQTNCPNGTLAELPAGVTVLSSGCSDPCTPDSEQSVEFVPPQVGTKIFFVYARNTATGRYSFGTRTSTEQAEPPAVTIQASKVEGDSPLTVNFKGNAVSTIEIDESRTTWDFDVDTPPDVDSTSRTVSHVYKVDGAQTRTYVARLTMYDTNGIQGSQEVAITVHGQGEDQGGVVSGNLKIIVGLPNTPDSDVSTGVSPFSVVLSVDATSLPGDLQAISWDLGDGSTSSSLVVPHTYVNDGTTSLRIPVTATVTTTTSATTTVNTSATRIITVEPGTGDTGTGGVDPCELPGTCAGGPGGSANPCGPVGMLPILMFVSLTWMRRKGR